MILKKYPVALIKISFILLILCTGLQAAVWKSPDLLNNDWSNWSGLNGGPSLIEPPAPDSEVNIKIGFFRRAYLTTRFSTVYSYLEHPVISGKRYEYTVRARMQADIISINGIFDHSWFSSIIGYKSSPSSGTFPIPNYSYGIKNLTAIINEDVIELRIYSSIEILGNATVNYSYSEYDWARLKQVIYVPKLDIVERNVCVTPSSIENSSATIGLHLNDLSFADTPTSWSIDWGDGTVESNPTLNTLHEHTYHITTGIGQTWTATLYGSNQAGSSSDFANIFVVPEPITITVDDDGPADFDNIQAAIDAACCGETIIVADGTYTGLGNRDIDFGGKAITVRSIDPSDPNTVAATIINCNGTEAEPHRGFYFHSGEDCNSVVAGFTIANGHAHCGGGIYCVSSSLTITNCVFRDNKAEYYEYVPWPLLENSSPMVNSDTGARIMCPPPPPQRRGNGAGFCCVDSNTTLTSCKFNGNSAYEQGGGMYSSGGSPTLINCIFNANLAGAGGGMANLLGSSPTLTNCTFTANSAEYGGGGMRNSDNSNPTLTNCIFSRNSAGWSGGLGNHYSSPTLTNCTFSGNSASEDGGGMNNYGSSPTLSNCTFTGNSAGISGGGIYCEGAPYPPPPPPPPSPPPPPPPPPPYPPPPPHNTNITNCILWGNEAPDGPEIYLGPDSNASVSYSDVQGGWPGEGNINADPYFFDPGYWDANGVWVDGDYHLLADSPCINAGDPNYVAEPNETDLDGRPRVIGGRIDMGAYEYSPPVPAEVRIVPRTLNLSSEGNWITCYIWLPEEYNVARIDPNSIFLEDEIQAQSLWLDEEEQVAIAKFGRSAVQGILNIGWVELTITGQLADGTVFKGTDVIRVIDKGGRKSAK